MAMNNDSSSKEWLTLGEAAELAGRKKPTVMKWVRDGFVFRSVAGFYSRASIENYMATGKPLGHLTPRSVAAATDAGIPTCANNMSTPGKVKGK